MGRAFSSVQSGLKDTHFESILSLTVLLSVTMGGHFSGALHTGQHWPDTFTGFPEGHFRTGQSVVKHTALP